MQESTHIGLDVHKETIAVAVLRPDGVECDERVIANTPTALRKLIARFPDRTQLRTCYEAGPTGYDTQRLLASLGVACEVIAPSLIPRRSGAHVKTDRLDARNLAHLHRAGAAQAAFDHLVGACSVRDAQLVAIERQIEAAALCEPLAEPVARLRAFRGIDTLAAVTILTETCDFYRFGSAGSYMAFTGLVPREHSSGASRHQGAITKAGNAHIRRVLVEAAWGYRHRPAVRGKLAVRQEGLPPDLLAYSWKAQTRLHAVYCKLAARRGTNKAVVAVARELAGFIWGAMTERMGAA